MNTQIDFGDLPKLLVDKMLKSVGDISRELSKNFEESRLSRSEWREKLQKEGLVRRDANLPNVASPTTCGIDGAYAVERLLSMDLLVAGQSLSRGLRHPQKNGNGMSHLTR